MEGNIQRPVINLRIHGDNIIECERALALIANSFSATVRRTISSPYLPRYDIRNGDGLLFRVELLPGHGQWNISLQEILKSCGAPLREASDAIVTRVLRDDCEEEILLALEFCNALPAGNQAWQRNGRALACATVGIPYLYFAEIGGIELGKNRVIKAPRFPNPIVPFSYLTTSKSFGVICLPVYSPSPSSSEAIRTQFSQVFGLEEGESLVRCILENTSTVDPREELIQKDLSLVKTLAEERRRVDTLRGDQWDEFLGRETTYQKAVWLEQNRMHWSKKRSSKVAVTETLPELIKIFQQINCISVGAGDIPLCLVPHHAREDLAESLMDLYDASVETDFIDWIALLNLPLIVVWITGFKPRGDDSRPDRGLMPLARMLFGDEADILSIVYGPAKRDMWKALCRSPQQLARQNGLWETLVNLSDAILVDSYTAARNPLTFVLERDRRCSQERIHFPLALPTVVPSENNIDSMLHMLFAHQERYGVFESMCNPPGGDWSGLSVLNFQTGEEFRWTSLPRVSGANSKRPDHVIQFLLDDGSSVLLAIESKDEASSLESNLGNRLRAYTERLVEISPTIAKAADSEWRLLQNDSVPLSNFSILSGGAFCWTERTKEETLENLLGRGKLDMVLAIEFKSIEQSELHIKVAAVAASLLTKICKLIQRFGGGIKIEIH